MIYFVRNSWWCCLLLSILIIYIQESNESSFGFFIDRLLSFGFQREQNKLSDSFSYGNKKSILNQYKKNLRIKDYPYVSSLTLDTDILVFSSISNKRRSKKAVNTIKKFKKRSSGGSSSRSSDIRPLKNKPKSKFS